MRSRLCLVLALALALVLVAAPAALAETYRGSGISADAFWEDMAEDTADYRFTSVSGGIFGDLMLEGTGDPVHTKGEVAMFSSASSDTGDPEDPSDDVYRDCFGFVEDANAWVSPKLASAFVDEVFICTVNEWVGTMPWDPETEEPVEPTNTYEIAVSADLEWTGVGSVSKSLYKSRWDDEFGSGRDSSKNVSRDASVSGTVVDADGNDLTFGLETFGSISKFRYATVFTEPIYE